MKTITPEVAAIIPAHQLKIVKANLKELSEEITALKARLEKCPDIKQTDKMKEHPAMFHYYFKETHIYICEYDRKDLMFGYTVLNGDVECSEWGYSSLSEITSISVMQLDLYFDEQSIEAALFHAYPKNFKIPQSLMYI